MIIYDDPQKFDELLHVIDYVSISVNFALSLILGYIFFRFFTDKKKTACIGTIAFHIPVITWTFFPYDTEMLRFIFLLLYIALSFGSMYLTERTRPRQKLLAVLMIYTFRGLSVYISSEINQPIVNFVFNNPKLNRLEWLLPEYIGIDLIEHLTFASYYLIMIVLYHKCYGIKDYEPDINGFLILSIPAVAHYISRKMYRENYATFLDYYNSLVERNEIETLQNLSWGSYTRIVETVISSLFLLAIVYLYMQSQKSAAQIANERLLEIQLNDTRTRLTQTEAIYKEMRSMKHDMVHQIRLLSDLVEKGETDEASRGLKSLEHSAKGVINEFSTGHPVTDVLFTDYRREAEASGISFFVDFSYDVSSGIDIFDLSMLLSNAISNAIKASASYTDAKICVTGKPRQNMFLITVKNTYREKMPEQLANIGSDYDEVFSSMFKSDDKSNIHGIGIYNIRKIASKYYGDISYESKDDMIILTVMLQMQLHNI